MKSGRFNKVVYPLLAGVIYLAYTLLLLYPVSFHIFTLLPGYAIDTYQHLWISWWYKYSLTSLHINPNNLVTLFAPNGMVNPLIWASPLPHLLSLPLQYLLGTIGTFNVMYIISFPLCGLAMYALAYDLTHHHAAAFIAGFIFAFFPAKTIHLVGHYLQFHIYWLPLYILFLLRLLKNPTWKNAALCGVFLGLSVLSHFIQAAQFVLPITLVIFVYAFFTRQKIWNAKVFLRLLVIFVVAVVIILPFYGPYLFGSHRSELETVTGGVSNFCPDLFNFFVPYIWHPLSTLIPSLFRYNLKLVPLGGNYVESVAYVGVFVFITACIGLLKRRKEALLWGAVALVGAVLSLGPLLHIGGQLVSIAVDDKTTYVPLPYLVFTRLPFLDAGRTPGRTGTLTMFGMALLSAYGVSWLSGLQVRWFNERKMRRLKQVALVLLALLMSFDYMLWPLPYFSSPVPSFFQQLRDTPGGAVLEFPSFLTYSSKLTEAPNFGLLDQMTHLRPINGGYLHRWDPVLRNETLDLDELILPQRDVDIVDYEPNVDLAGLLRQIGYEYVVIHKPYTDTMPADVKSQRQAFEWKGTNVWPEQIQGNERVSLALGAPVFEDQSVWIYHVAPATPASSAGAWLYLGDGWEWVTLTKGYPSRKLLSGGEIIIEPLQPGSGRIVCAIVADQDTALTLTYAGQVIDRFELTANVPLTVTSAAVALQPGPNKLILSRADDSALASVIVSHLTYHAD